MAKEQEDPRVFFAAHHEAYGTSPRHARGEDLTLLIDRLNPISGQTALDVATGGGHTALKLAEYGLAVTVVDITTEMLTDAVNMAKDKGLTLQAVEAPAESLPFADEHFDFITCRRAAHHFRNIEAFLSESRRVARIGGRLGISDMTGSNAHIDWLNQLESRRDGSHHQALSPDQWYDLLIRTGWEDITIQLLEEPMSLEEWLSPVSPDTATGKSALAFVNNAKTPIEFFRHSRFIKRRILIWATKIH